MSETSAPLYANTVTGELRNVRKHRCEGGLGYILVGQIYEDERRRFPDGEWVHTSYVTAELGDGVFVTRNSTYRVVSWARDTLDDPVKGSVA